eukprot:5481773-Pyramimonas_sp.AAC.1
MQLARRQQIRSRRIACRRARSYLASCSTGALDADGVACLGLGCLEEGVQVLGGTHSHAGVGNRVS